jgi:exosortase/archaeosortase family protein
VEGFVIFIGTHRYIVVDECSGLAFVTLGIFLGYSFGLLLYRSVFRIAALALFGAFLGIFSNVVRVNAIVLIDWLRGSQMELTAHGAIQWLALVATLGLLFYVLSRLKGDAQPAMPAVVGPQTIHPVRRFGPVLAGLSMLLIGGSAAAVPASEVRPSHGVRDARFAPTVAGWELVKPADVWAVDEQTHTESIELAYRHRGQDIRIVIVEPLSGGAKLPESRLVPRDEGVWRQKQIQQESACTALRCIRLLHSTWQHDKGEQLRHVYYAYSIGTFTSDSKLAFRAVQGWHRLSRAPEAPRLIAFISDAVVADVDELGAAFEVIRFAAE